MKNKTHTKQSGLSEQEQQKLIEKRKSPSAGAIKKDERHMIMFSKFVFSNDAPQKYQNNIKTRIVMSE